ncbi:MAG: flagellar motor protein MotB [Oscillospiraceae bacterium]
MPRPRDRKEPEEEGSGYNWMDTYGDLVTLLLCFFVLLYSFSSIDAVKWQELVGAFSGSTAVSVELMDTQTVRKNEIEVEGVDRASNDQKEKDNNVVEEQNDEEFDKLYNIIKLYIEENNLTALLSVQKEDNIILVRFKEAILFESGKAVILDGSKPVLDHIISVLSQNINTVKMIRIEGHTDNVPIHTAEFDSNWELSMARASNALKYFINSDKINLDKLSAVAYGEYQPIESNDTKDGRASNRRVDFVIEKADDSSQTSVLASGNK